MLKGEIINQSSGKKHSVSFFDDDSIEEPENFAPLNLDADRELSVPEWMLYESH
jgi:hypothetical protein